jgi:hypothetical protein
MTESKALATTPQGAMATPGAGAAIQFSLSKFPEADYNRLVPTDTLIASDLLMPVVQVVRLDFEDDTYKSNDVPANHRAPGARALNKFATAAGLSFLSETRVDNGRNPNLIRVQVVVGMKLLSGQWVTATGTREVDLERRKWASPAERAKFESFFYEHTATRARSRAIRAILSLKSSYTDEEIRKPFAVVSLVPNTAHPEVRRAMLAGLEHSERALFGPAPEQPRAIGPGLADVALPEAPDDETVEGQFIEAGPATEARPEWMAGSSAPPRHRLLALLQDNVAASAASGPATDQQMDALSAVLGPFGLAAVAHVLKYAFGLTLTDGKFAFSAAQAQAIMSVAVSMPGPEFRSLWIELGAVAAAKGAA